MIHYVWKLGNCGVDNAGRRPARTEIQGKYLVLALRSMSFIDYSLFYFLFNTSRFRFKCISAALLNSIY